MSCHVIFYQDGAKHTRPVFSPQEYLALRDSERQRELAARARAGDQDAKRKLLQFNYSCIPGEDGLLRGCKVASNSVGMDIDFPKGNQVKSEQLTVNSEDTEPKESLEEWLAMVPEKVLSKKEELGLLMLERSASKGYHVVFRRRPELTQEENLKWASNLLGVKYDEGAKDITRVFFSTTGSPEDLWFLSEELFDQEAASPQSFPITANTQSPLVAEVTTPIPSQEGLGEGLPYHLILPAIFTLCCESYPNVPEGTRNDTLYRVALYLRYICDFSEAKMKALLYPTYAYGLPEHEVDSLIRSALMKQRGRMPQALVKILTRFGAGGNVDDDDNDDDDCKRDPLTLNPYSIYPSLSSCVLDDLAMPRLPRWIDMLIKVVQPGYRFITIVGASTAMMTLLSDVRKKYGTKPVSRLNGWTHWDGLSGSGKRQLKTVIDQLVKPIREDDARKRERVNEIVLHNQTAPEGEKKVVPPLGQRILECDTTRKAHILQMEALKGKKTFTFAEELSSLNLNRAGYYFRGDFCRLLFDNGMVGNLNAAGDSTSHVTECNWDVTTTSTHDQTLAQWARDVQNGAAQRIFFCLVPDNTWQRKPRDIQWTAEEVAYLDRASALMMKLQGLTLTPKLDKAMDEWLDNILDEQLALPLAQRNVERSRFRFRSSEIAHTLGVVLHCCFIVQEILDREDELNEELRMKNEELAQVKGDPSSSCEQVAEAERAVIAARDALETWKGGALDLDQYTENKACVALGIFAADYCLDMQDMLWSKRMRAQLTASFEGVEKSLGRGKSDEDYEKLPQRFKLEDLHESMPEKSNEALKKMVQRFVKTNLVRKVGMESRTAIYEKTVA